MNSYRLMIFAGTIGIVVTFALQAHWQHKMTAKLQTASDEIAFRDDQIRKATDSYAELRISYTILQMDMKELGAQHRQTVLVLNQQKKLLSLAMKAIRNANVDDKELVDQALRAIKEYGVGDSDFIGKPTYNIEPTKIEESE